MSSPKTVKTRTRTRAENIRARDRKIVERVNELHNIERKRFDDVLAQVSNEFFLTEGTIRKILYKTV